MLHELGISSLGVIDGARLQLGQGLTVVTGETGAGKTMVLTGLGLILGAKASPDSVRSGAAEAVAEAVIDLPAHSQAFLLAADAGVRVDDDGTVTVSRIVGATSRSRSVLGGRTVPQSLLAEVASETVTVHGQADQMRLRTPSRQRDTLDAFGGPEHAAILEKYRESWRHWNAAKDERDRMRAGAGNTKAELARLRQDLEEIEAVNPQPEEDESLTAEARVLDNAEAVRLALAGAHDALSADGEGTALAAIEAARRALAEAVRHDPRLEAIEQRLAEFSYGVADVATELSRQLTNLEADPARLDAIHARRSQLAGLARRLGVPLGEVQGYAESAAARVAEDDDWDQILAQREQEELAARTQLEQVAALLHTSRRENADVLEGQVAQELAHLAMPDAAFEVQVTAGELGPHGGDSVSMMLAAHPGANFRPVAEAASGGELSRIMLAIEVSLASRWHGRNTTSGDRATQSTDADSHDVIRTFVFDEVDAGVGGKAALAVGARLAELAKTHQVIVVTHLAQVAAFADHHIVVTKSTDSTVTVAQVQEVSGEDRVSEVARLLSGHEDSQAARAHALELLDGAFVAR